MSSTYETREKTDVGERPIMELDSLSKLFHKETNILESLKNAILGQEAEKIRAVDELNLTLSRQSVEGVVGESGCGKTTLLLTLMGLHKPTGGELYFDGEPISEFDKKDWKEFRRRVQIIFQDPFNAMDPKLNVRETLKEPLSIHNLGNKEERSRDILRQVELNPPEKYLDRMPKQLSGGEKQRVAIGRALILEPDVILADEPVSMLDVSTQASILKLLRKLTDDLGVSMVYISHDLSTVSYVCDYINVMYLGRIVESQPTEDIIDDPMHPYTQALISAIPVPDPHQNRKRTSMEGRPSDPIGLPSGCRFKDRCPERMEICDKKPLLWDVDEERQVACHLYYDHETVSADRQTGGESNGDE